MYAVNKVNANAVQMVFVRALETIPSRYSFGIHNCAATAFYCIHLCTRRVYTNVKTEESFLHTAFASLSSSPRA